MYSNIHVKLWFVNHLYIFIKILSSNIFAKDSLLLICLLQSLSLYIRKILICWWTSVSILFGSNFRISHFLDLSEMKICCSITFYTDNYYDHPENGFARTATNCWKQKKAALDFWDKISVRLLCFLLALLDCVKIWASWWSNI